jgi:MYXO-CTERM domain-containing protein
VAATMFAHYVPGTISMRVLSQDDRDGICSSYLPNGTRSVDPSVSPNGTLQAAACDPTPRHGFQSSCAQPHQSGCSAAPASDPAGFSGTAGVMATALLVAARARRRPREPRV